MPSREEDARFLKSEKLLIKAAAEEIKSGGGTTITKICQRAGIFKSTFYRHYPSLDEMVNACERNLLKEFNDIISVAVKKKLTIEVFFNSWAYFIHRNKNMFWLSIVANQLSLLMTMMQSIQQVATTGWRSSPQKIEQIYLIYSYEVAGIWLTWAEQEEFDINKIPVHTQELSFLTRTALRRLGGIEIFNNS